MLSGDTAAAAKGKGSKEPKNKRVPDDQRNTTPYMTKYERARILGTRALQIRSVFPGWTVAVTMQLQGTCADI